MATTVTVVATVLRSESVCRLVRPTGRPAGDSYLMFEPDDPTRGGDYMEIPMDEIQTPRISMQINGHRFVTAFRVDHPHGVEPTEYAIFQTDDAYIVSVASGGDPKMGRLEAASDAEAISDAHRAVDDFHSVDHEVWKRRAVYLYT